MKRLAGIVSIASIAGVVIALGWASQPGPLDGTGVTSPGGIFRVDFEKPSLLESLLPVHDRSPAHVLLAEVRSGRRLARSPVLATENVAGPIEWEACRGAVSVGLLITFEGLSLDGTAAGGCTHPPPPAAAAVRMTYDAR